MEKGYIGVATKSALSVAHCASEKKKKKYCCVQHRECPSSSVLAIGSTLLFHPAASHLVTRLYLMIIVQYLIPYTFIDQSNVNSQGIYCIGNIIR